MNINRKLDNWWNNTSMFGYRTGYTLTHPWEIAYGIKKEIKWAWQRVFRGWDDRIVWSVDGYLSKMLPIWLTKLKEDMQGTPLTCFEEGDWNEETCKYSDEAVERASKKWNGILDEMIEGFKAYKQAEDDGTNWKIGTPEYDEFLRKYYRAMDLLKNHFGSLWD
jgi:hypothetical protein